MNIYDTVKQNVTARQAAELYGIEVDCHGMCCCPFHNDRRPSAKIDTRFHCFGCGDDFSVIDFTAKLFGLQPVEACKKLAADFNIPIENDWYRPQTVAEIERKKIALKSKQFDDLSKKMFFILRDYYNLLLDWRKYFAPKNPEEKFDPRFLESLRNTDFVDWALDILNIGTANQKADFMAEFGRKVIALEGRIRKFNGRTESGSRQAP